MPKGGHGLFLQASDCHDPTPNGDLTGHGDIPPDRTVCQRRDKSGADRDTGRWSVFGYGAFREMDVNVFRLIKIRRNTKLIRS